MLKRTKKLVRNLLYLNDLLKMVCDIYGLKYYLKCNESYYSVSINNEDGNIFHQESENLEKLITYTTLFTNGIETALEYKIKVKENK